MALRPGSRHGNESEPLLTTRAQVQSPSPPYPDSPDPEKSLPTLKDHELIQTSVASATASRKFLCFSIELPDPLPSTFLQWLSYLYNNHRWFSFLPSVVLGFIIWAVFPTDVGISKAGVRLFAIFLSVIAGLLTSRYNLTILSVAAITLLAVTLSLTCRDAEGRIIDCELCGQEFNGTLAECDPYEAALDSALSGYANHVEWIVVSAFFLGTAIMKTGLGKRLSLWLIRLFGYSLLGIGYSICISEFLLGSVIPSNTARGGGVMSPLVVAMAEALESNPKDATGRENGGEFLILVGAHANLISASMYLTAMAANPIMTDLAHQIFDVDWNFLTWLAGSIVPGLCSMALLPLTIKFISRPKVNVKAARLVALEKLAEMGRMTRDEIKVLVVILIMLALWVSEPFTGYEASWVAIFGVVLLLFINVLEVDDLTTNYKAWDTFLWLGAFIVMANQLNLFGISSLMANSLSDALQSLPYLGALLILGLVFFFTMYLFSSLTGHLISLAGPFLIAAKNLQTPPLLALSLISYLATQCGCLTPFSSGPIVVYFGYGYVKSLRWFAVGAIVGVTHLMVMYSVGLGWWKLLGRW